MYVTYAIIGLLLGVIAGGTGSSVLTGAAAGVVIGILVARLKRLEDRTARLAASLDTPQNSETLPSDETTEPPPTARVSETVVSSGQAVIEESPQTLDPETEWWGDTTPSAESPRQSSGETYRETQLSLGPSPFEWFFDRAKNWITTGNVPVKVGVIISFIGVSFLLKYAIDREILVLSLELRLLAVAFAGAVMMATGWRLRKKVQVYALSLQGGGAGVLFLTIFAALRLWHLLSEPLAFVLLITLAFFTGALAVMQNARGLAVLGIVGGFLAPVLATTGQGSHVILFSYYLVLNGAILGIAWFRSWRELNLIGFAFTFLISIYWGYQYFKPSLFSSTEPFLILYFLFYQLIAILYALRQPPDRMGLVDGTLVFGTPVITFALQANLLSDTEYGLAISAACAAAIYTLLATWLKHKKGDYLNLLSESFLALAVAFATIAVPLALDARWTSAAWALEGTALIWVGIRQKRHLASLAGTGLILLSGLAFMDDGWRNDTGMAIVNGNVLGGLMISISALFASRRLDFHDSRTFVPVYRLAATALFIWGFSWWMGTAWLESVDRMGPADRVPAFLLFAAVSTVAAVWLGRVRNWRRMQLSLFVFLPLLILLALMENYWNDHFLVGLGWLAWPGALATQLLVLRDLDHRRNPLAPAWHVLTLILFTVLLAFEGSWWTDGVASTDWARAAAATTTGFIALLVLGIRNKPDWPVPVQPTAYMAGVMILVASQVAGLSLLGLLAPGDPAPLSYFPIINPFDLAMLFSFLTAWFSLSVIRRDSGNAETELLRGYIAPYRILLTAGAFIMTSAALVRGIHYFTAIPWNPVDLYGSVVVQTTLSIYWGLIGFSGMIVGARQANRPVWLIGASLMALVVIKLFLIDLGNTGSVERIISFIGIGVLLLIVGYFAPAPPKENSSS